MTMKVMSTYPFASLKDIVFSISPAKLALPTVINQSLKNWEQLDNYKPTQKLFHTY